MAKQDYLRSRLKALLDEFLEALRKGDRDPMVKGTNYGEWVKKQSPLIDLDEFFSLTEEELRKQLVWVNAAYFGRGEGALELQVKGVLRSDFHSDFQDEIDLLMERKKGEGYPE